MKFQTNHFNKGWFLKGISTLKENSLNGSNDKTALNVLHCPNQWDELHFVWNKREKIDQPLYIEKQRCYRMSMFSLLQEIAHIKYGRHLDVVEAKLNQSLASCFRQKWSCQMSEYQRRCRHRLQARSVSIRVAACNWTSSAQAKPKGALQVHCWKPSNLFNCCEMSICLLV